METVSPGHALLLEPGGSCRPVAWWQAPEAGLPLAEAALALRSALCDAVALRVRPGQVLAADLSGGMDATSLCFLAAEAGASLVTATLHWEALGNENQRYARYAADRLPDIESLVFPSAELPSCFAGLECRQDPPGGALPCTAGPGDPAAHQPRVACPGSPHCASRGMEATTPSYPPPPTSIPCCAAILHWRYGMRPGSKRNGAGHWVRPSVGC
ncbi:asparagine synthase-related protein [Streptomyces flavofungini]|uniref:asparagine synthase-related protein n=1 Tax=Streptomyces flavofungini TaxID=68200 RepID=UPI0034DEA8DE